MKKTPDYAQNNMNAVAIRKTRLKAAMLTRLNAMGAVTWETPRSVAGSPTVNAVIGGFYYGFYPSGIPTGSGADVGAAERDTLKRINDNGGYAAIVASIDSMEAVMNLNLKVQEIRRALPTKTLAAQLKQWGKGKLRGSALDQEIARLPSDIQNVVFGLYVDGMTHNEIAEASGLKLAMVFKKQQQAINALSERLVTKGTYMEDLGRVFSPREDLT
jgi:hypothetical protein